MSAIKCESINDMLIKSDNLIRQKKFRKCECGGELMVMRSHKADTFPFRDESVMRSEMRVVVECDRCAFRLHQPFFVDHAPPQSKPAPAGVSSSES